MGKVIAKRIKGMTWTAKISLVLLCTVLSSVFMYEGWYKPQATLAAITAQSAWGTALYSSTASPGALAYTVGAGSNRLLVVAVSSSLNAASTQSCAVTYGGQTLTKQITDETSSAQQHTWLFYLNDAGITAAGASTGINVTLTAGSSTFVNSAVYASVYAGVNQSAPITSSKNYNSGTNTTSSPVFATAMTENAGDQPVIIANSTRTGSSSARSFTATTNWTLAKNASTSTTPAVATAVLNRTSPVSNTSDTTGATISSSTLASMSGMSIAAQPSANTTIGNGVAITASSVCPGTTVKLDGFSLYNNLSADSVTGLVVTTTGTTQIASMSIWDEAGANQYFATQTVPSGNSWTFSGGTPIPVTASAANYKVTVTYTGTTPASSTATTAYVSSFTSSQTASGSNTVGPAVTVKGVPGAASWRSPVVSGATIRLNSIGTNADYVMVVRYPNSTDTTVPVNGTGYTNGSAFGTGTIISVGGTSTTITDTPPVGTYYYKAFGYTSCNTYAAASPFTSAVSYISISSAAPATLGQGSTQDLYLNGSGFSSSTATTVTFGNSGITANGNATVLSTTQMKVNVTVTAAATGTSTITVTPSGSPSVTTGSLLTVGVAPTVTTLSPATANQGASGSQVTITGTGFQSGAAVAVSGGDITVSTSYVSATQLKATLTVPANAALGFRNVTVTNPDNGSASSIGSLTVLPPLYTITGALTSPVASATSITVQAAYSGDNDNDGSCVVTWGTVPGQYPNTATVTKQGGMYTATITGLTGGADGAGSVYYFSAQFSDGDGVNGTNPVLGTFATAGSPLMHNSINLGSAKWAQGWGTATGKYGSFTCSTCHFEGSANRRAVAGSIQAPSMENWSSLKTSNSASVAFNNANPNLGDDSAHATSTNVCEVCHNRTAYNRYNNTNPTAHHGGTDCTSCHSHGQGFAPDSVGGRACLDCHASLNSGAHHHDLSATASCLTCHVDHNIFRTDINAANSTGRAANLLVDSSVAPVPGAPGTTYTNTDFVAAATNGGVCVSCHLSAQTKPDSTLTETVAKADFTASAHNYTALSIYKKDGSSFSANCAKCHSDDAAKKFQTAGNQFSTHGSSVSDILAPMGDPSPTINGFCFRCHSKTTDAVNGTAKAAAGVDYNGAGAMGSRAEGIFAMYQKSGSVHNQILCANCHNSHATKQGIHTVGSNLAGPTLNGIGGVTPTFPGFWSAPAAGNFTTKAALVAGTDLEAYLCLKCHSAAAGTLPISPSGGFTMTDVAKEFNPNNRGAYNGGTYVATQTAGGFHPVFAYATNNLGAIKLANLVTTNFAWSKTARNMMTCSDCHGSDTTTDPSGPHGSAAKFLLRGPNTKWDNTLKLSGSGMPAGTFCANCHDPGFANSRFTSHTSNHSSALCLDCHAAIPHGGPRPGMLVSPVGVTATAVPAQMSDWDTNTTYAGTGHKNYILSYPSNNTSGWSSSNCGCNGTGGM